MAHSFGGTGFWEDTPSDPHLNIRGTPYRLGLAPNLSIRAMELLTNLLQQSKQLLPLVAALAGVSIVLAAAHILLERRYGNHPQTRFRVQLILITLTFIGLLVIVLSLPLDDSLRGQLLGFLGILLSAAIALSSTTFLGNALAGILLRVVAGFRIGDFIRVKDDFGRVTERGLFHTEIQTEDRDLTTLPNLYLVTNPVRMVRSSGTIVSATVSLGYNVPRLQIEEALRRAADSIGLEDPFIQITDFGDFAVSYRIAGLLPEVKHLLSTRSALRAAVLDALHSARIEIVSPTFMNTRALQQDSVILPPSPATHGKDPEREARAPEDVVFDKAEEAEKIEDLATRHRGLEEQIKLLRDEAKAAQADEERQELEERIAQLESAHERLGYVVERARETHDES
jgi:small conductance mechanosensitive channel